MQGISEEFVICCKKLGEISHEQDSFAHDGDSGLLVIDDQGKVCGLLYDAVSGSFWKDKYFVNAGLVMSFTEISASVELKSVSRYSNREYRSLGIRGLSSNDQ